MAGSFDSTLIDQIVVEVLSQLRQRVGSTTTSNAKSAPPTQSAPKRTIVELGYTVITGEILKKAGLQGGNVRVSPKAIITPSARDYLREYKVQLVQNSSSTTAEKTTGKSQGIIVASHLPNVVQTFLNDVKNQFSPAWKVEIESGNAQVIERTRSIVCRGESPQVVVFVKEPHRVTCFLNRNSHCRAGVVQRVSDVQALRSEIGANVICVDLGQPSFMELRNIFRAVMESISQIREPSEG